MVINQYPDFLQNKEVEKIYLSIYLSIIIFPDGAVVKNPPANAGDARIWVWSLGQEVPLEEEMATHSIILAWKIPWTEGPRGL